MYVLEWHLALVTKISLKRALRECSNESSIGFLEYIVHPILMKSESSSISVNIFLRVKKEGEAVVILFPIFSSSVYLKWPLEGIGE